MFASSNWVYIFLILFVILLIGATVAITLNVTGYDANVIPENDITKILHLGYYDLTDDETEVYALMFHKYAKKYDIDWKIYPAIITIESAWRTHAVSSCGAIGTMQVMPETFKLECKRHNIEHLEGKTIYNDIILMRVGLEYLSRMIVEHGLKRGVKSYVGGPAHSETCQDCIEYLAKFNAEYEKVKRLSTEYKRIELFIINKALNQ